MAIPITNGEAFIAAPLKDGETCLNFQDADGLIPVIELALAMDSGEVSRMQQAGRDYYDRFLEPKSFAGSVIGTNEVKILVNAEEKCVPLVFPDKKFSRNI